MKKKISKLSGAALDWAVAKCEGIKLEHYSLQYGCIVSHNNEDTTPCVPGYEYAPSTNWSQGGPIIEREKISVVCAQGEYQSHKAGTPDAYAVYWVAEAGMQSPVDVYGAQSDNYGEYFLIDDSAISGSTPLIAAMRCYIYSKLGKEIEIPEELI